MPERRTLAAALASGLASLLLAARLPACAQDTSEPPPPESRVTEQTGERGEWGWAGLPFVNFNSDEGMGYGGRLALYNRDPEIRRYHMQLAIQAFLTSRSVQHHEVYLDLPSLANGWWRLTAKVKYDHWLLSNYYGIGNTLPDLNAFGDPGPVDLSASDRQTLRDYFYSFQETRPELIVTLRHPLAGYFGMFTGARVLKDTVQFHTPSTLEKEASIEVDPGWTSYLEQQLPYGADGGTVGVAQFGIYHDTRDQEASPQHGSFTEVSARVGSFSGAGGVPGASPVLGGFNVTDRHYVTIAPTLVFASRAVADLVTGDVPFFELSSFGGLSDYSGLGGSVSLRGFRLNTFRGKVKVLASPELRYTPWEFRAFNQRFNAGLTAFADLGRVWGDYTSEGGLLDAHSGAGLGGRLAWNDDFVIRLDVARSRAEGTRVYLEFDNAF